MLECGKNFKGSMKSECDLCKCLDDEEHRLNYCQKYNDVNFSKHLDKMPFANIFVDDIDTLRMMIDRIISVWNVKTGKGSMNT